MWVTSRIIGRGVDNVDRVDRVICVLFGWRQSKRRILGAGRIKNVKVCREATIIRQQFKALSYKSIEPEELVKERRGDVGQDGDCISFAGSLV